LLKKSKTDGETQDDGPPPRRLLIAGNDEAPCEVYAGVLASYGFETESAPLGGLVPALHETVYGCVVLLATGGAESTALKQLDAMRHSDHTHVRRTAAVMLATSRSKRLFAWESGVDGFIVMPAEATEIVECIEDVLARPRLERYNHRQAMLAKARDE
jgi:DNA-binding response OmpR family regulator